MRHLSISAALVAGSLMAGTAWAQVGGGSVGGGSVGGSGIGSSPSVGGTASPNSALPPESRPGNAPSLSNQGLMGTAGSISNQGLQSSSGSIAEEGLQDITGSPQGSDIGATGLPTGSPPALSETEDPEVDLGPARDVITTTTPVSPGTEGSRVGSAMDNDLPDPVATGTVSTDQGPSQPSSIAPSRRIDRLIQEEAVEERGICAGC